MACAMRPPRREIALSTSCATTNAATTVAMAVMPARCSVQNEAATMGRQAIERPRLPALGAERAAALRDAAVALVASRLLVWLTAIVAAAVARPDSGASTLAFDRPELTHPFGPVLDALFSPLARWDAVWFLDVAHSGYGGADSAFFPLYPLLVRGLAPAGAPAALLPAAYAVALAALAGALYLLRRLAELELGNAVAARRATLLLAFFPGALWLGAPYSESVFLLLSIGAIYAARTGRWAWAGACPGLASGTRTAGIVLLVPLAILWWRSRLRRPRDAPWLAIAPAGLAGYTV